MFKIVFRAQIMLLCGTIGCSHAGRAGGPGSGSDMSANGGSTDMSGALTITPLDATVMESVVSTPPTLQYAATLNGVTVNPSWSIDRGEIGTIDLTGGLFTAATTALGGTARVTANYQGATATTTITVVLTQVQLGDPAATPPIAAPGAGGYGGVGGDGPAPPATGTPLGTLQNGTPGTDAMVKLLYPYDQTVWPRGLLAPLIQWDPATHAFDAVELKLHEKNFDYTGYFANNATAKPPNNPNGIFRNLMIPAQVWYALTYSNLGATDDVTVTLTFAQGTTAIALAPITWHIAPGTLEGTVYYNSYGTGQVANSGSPSCGNADVNCSECNTGKETGPAFGAATLAIKPGAKDPIVVAGASSADGTGCRVCHSVSADGNTLSTQHGDSGDVQQSLYALTMNYLETPAPIPASGGQAFPALYPDQTNHPLFLSNAGGIPVAIQAISQLYSTATATPGQLVAMQPTMPFASFQASLPTFSGDGKHLAFIDWGRVTPNGGDQKSLAVMDFDVAGNAFTNFKVIDTPALGTDSWSSFLPTNDAVVFEHEVHAGAAQDPSCTNVFSPEWGFTRYTGQGELSWVDTATGTAHTLDRANGIGAAGPYLPTYGTNHSGAGDAQLNFEPTANPVVSGGYAWVVFTSRRTYGNVATLDPYQSDPRDFPWQKPGIGYTTKKLWVAAIDLNAKPGTDPSHPAFYLPAQEIIAGNSRGFWAVDPCRKDGAMCDSGDECCHGYCEAVGDGGALECSSQVPMCSALYDKCTVDSDCCDAKQGITCINGFCVGSGPITSRR